MQMEIQFSAASKMLLRSMKDRDSLFRFIFIGAMSLLLVACQSTPDYAPELETYNYAPIYFAGIKATPAERSKCEVVGGEYMQNVGIAGIDICHQDLPDAGKICRDSDECLSECMAVKSANVGKRATGQCSL